MRTNTFYFLRLNPLDIRITLKSEMPIPESENTLSDDFNIFFYNFTAKDASLVKILMKIRSVVFL